MIGVPESFDLAELSAWVEGATGLPAWAQWRLTVSATILLVVLASRLVVLHLVSRRTDDVRVTYRWKKVTSYVAFLLVVTLWGWVWITGFRAVATYLGLVSAGVAIALREPLVNLVGWMFILWRRPFVVGDRVEIGDRAGDVIDLRLFQFTLLEIGNWVDADQSTGRVIHVPNGRVFSEPVANYTKGFRFIWNELPVVVTFESDWKKAKEILRAVASEKAPTLSEAAQAELRQASRQFMIFYSKLTPNVYTRVVDIGVELTIRYLCDPRQRRGTSEAIWEEILERFAEHDDIDFAYPTQRFYDNTREGKPGARAEPPEGDRGG